MQDLILKPIQDSAYNYVFYWRILMLVRDPRYSEAPLVIVKNSVDCKKTIQHLFNPGGLGAKSFCRE